jgi:hypothetical protein
MCIARIFQLIRLPINPDLSKITTPGVVLPDNYLNSFKRYCRKWFSKINLNNLKKTGRSKVHTTMKSGPNGHALVYAAHDLTALFKEKKLISSILTLNDLLGNS